MPRHLAVAYPSCQRISDSDVPTRASSHANSDHYESATDKKTTCKPQKPRQLSSRLSDDVASPRNRSLAPDHEYDCNEIYRRSINQLSCLSLSSRKIVAHQYWRRQIGHDRGRPSTTTAIQPDTANKIHEDRDIAPWSPNLYSTAPPRYCRQDRATQSAKIVNWDETTEAVDPNSHS